MRFLSHLILVAAAAFTTAAVAGHQPGFASIQVRGGDWGSASLDDIHAVLDSVARAILHDISRQSEMRIVVQPSASGPRVLAARAPDGAYQVMLSARDTRWDQFAYQFAHELCHVVSNYDLRDAGSPSAPRPHQWFEETLCEAVSVVALNRLSMQWDESPPHAAWRGYAPAFKRYARRLLDAEHRRLAPGQSLAAWYRANAEPLARDPYLRARNELAATALLELVVETPGSLSALGYLNAGNPAGADFSHFLAAWLDCCPESHRPFVQRLIALLGAA